MVIIKLQGGLGNQMFQYALGRTLSLTHNVPFKLDISFYDKNIGTKREYLLNNFNIVEQIADISETKNFLKHIPRKGRLGRLYTKFFVNGNKYVQENTSTFNPKVLENRDDCYYDGYWQAEKYFKKAEDILRKEFTLTKPIDSSYTKILEKINNTSSVAIHIRRGDYVTDLATNKHHGVAPIEYYKKAISELSKKIENPTFFVFSDDIKWAKDNITINSPIEFVSDEKNNPYEELIVMSRCKHFIIANSSFSWWGAWLSDNKNKIIYAPKKWFNKGWDTIDYTPSNWIRI